ncbi:SDR family oxidoreductase [Streptomyces sp. NPDC007088]|uniref:SDR family oxidoreductase n=1 Tax=Streptomyces sp. NPDC007088 TaxID=3364773 RepID=UPI0036BE66D5
MGVHTGRLVGRTALVTGGGRGIGRGIAERLGREGARVGVHYGHDKTSAKETVAAIGAAGGSAFLVHAELGTPGDARRLWENFDREAGELDILVNNAGIGTSGTYAEIDEADYDKLFAVNTRAPFFVTRLGLDRMRDTGRIVNVSTGLTHSAVMPDLVTYSMTKAALEVFTRDLSRTVGPRGITVNAVAPGIIATDNTAGILASAEGRAEAAGLSALGRVGEPADVADVVAFLASDDSRWVTGAWIDVTGGSV